MAITIVRTGTTYASIQAALNAALTNDEITVTAGTYAENLVFNATQNTKTITVTAIGAVVINANNASRCLYITDGSVVTSGNYTFNGITFANTGAGSQVDIRGICNLFFNNCNIGSSATTSSNFVFAGTTSTATNVTITGGTIQRPTSTALATGISIFGMFGTLTLDNVAVTHGGGYFITLSANGGNLTVTNCEFDTTTYNTGGEYSFFTGAETLTMGTVTFRYNNFTASKMAFGFPSGPTTFIAEYNTVTYPASVTSTGVGIAAGKDGSTYPTARVTNITVRYNTVTFEHPTIQSHGIIVGRGASVGECCYNTVNNGDFGIVVKSDTIDIHHNTINKQTVDADANGGIYIRCGSNNTVRHNTVYVTDGFGIQGDTQSGGTAPVGNIIRDNIFVQKSTNASSLIADSTGASDGNMDTWVFDNNIYLKGTTAKIASLNFGAVPPTLLTTLTDLTGASGWAAYSAGAATNDINSIAADPLFNDVEAGDFSLPANSPAIAAASDGTTIGAWQSDFGPTVTVLTSEGAFQNGANVLLSATATDPETHSLTIYWYSNIDGIIGSGDNILINTLSVGNHLITARATDGAGNTDEDSIKIAIYSLDISLITDTSGTYDTAPLYERARFRSPETVISFVPLNINHTATKWKISETFNQNAEFTVTTDNYGLVGEFGNILYGSLTEIRIVLDRTKDYYIQIQINNGSWSDKTIIDLQPSMAYLGHETKPLVVETEQGATVEQQSPRWTEEATSSGVTITNLVYTGSSSNKPSETSTQTGAIIRNE